MESKNKRESEKEGEGDSSWQIFPSLETLKPIRCKETSTQKPERKDDKLREEGDTEQRKRDGDFTLNGISQKLSIIYIAI